jgi:uncharacterized protein (TIGR03435 family)
MPSIQGFDEFSCKMRAQPYSEFLRAPFVLMLNGMRLSCVIASALLTAAAPAWCQPTQPVFDVASVRPSAHMVGPDYNNQISWTAEGFTGRNVTLRRLIADAWNLQLDQVIGPPWLDRNEYDIEARSADGATREQRALMLRSLLVDRFGLKQHREARMMRVYELTVGKDGPKIKPAAEGESHAGAGFHFHGDMRQFADLLAVQFTIPAAASPSEPVRAGGPAIPVLDKTGLDGVYDFSIDMRPELGTDAFTGWQRVLDQQLGLKIESRRAEVEVCVIDDAAQVPSAN